ncbi:adenosylhomocysteinase [Streptomyces sp. NPDC060210]|uniref:adenosylhomocysteinase n=2 Tax=unclassified Streptomyces TaxID=2593676 RepID=UPI00365913C6
MRNSVRAPRRRRCPRHDLPRCPMPRPRRRCSWKQVDDDRGMVRMPTMEWVTSSCRLLASTAVDFERERPFAGLRIGAAIHLEPKTATLLLVLARGGADVVATGNLRTTQGATLTFLREQGVTVIGDRTRDPHTEDACLRQVLATRPHLLLDNGGGLFLRYLDAPYEGLLGGTEETTSGRAQLMPVRARIKRPVLVINDSPIKQFAENTHAVGQSVLESFLRITNRATNGRRVTVIGYGACGRGIAKNFAHAHARVAVWESDPVRRLEAMFDGYAVPGRREALASADIIVTSTGNPGILTAEDLPLLSDGVILVNAGHLPWEIDVPGLLAHPTVLSCTEPTEGLQTLTLSGGARVNILTEGHMVNLNGPRPLGNSVESMDLGFTLQARCLEAIAAGRVSADQCVVPVPPEIDAQVAQAYVALAGGERPVNTP